MSSIYTKSLAYLGLTFAIIYTLEIILKLIAYGISYFWSLHSYKFATIVVLSQWFAFIYYIITNPNDKNDIGYIIPFNVLMIFRFVLIIPKFQTFIEILSLSTKSILYNLLFLFLVCFIFAIMGVALFNNSDVNSDNTKYTDDFLTDLTSPSNFFIDLWSALYILYIYGTSAGDSWTPVIIELTQKFDSWKVALYFVSFFIIVVIIVASIFSAVLVE